MPCNCNKDRSPRDKKTRSHKTHRSHRSHRSNRSHQNKNNRNAFTTTPVPRSVTATPVPRSVTTPVPRAVTTPVYRIAPASRAVTPSVSSVPITPSVPTNHVVLQNNYTRYIQNRNQTRQIQTRIQQRTQTRTPQDRLAEYHKRHNEATQYKNVKRSELRSWDKIHQMAVNATTDDLVKDFTEYIEYLGNNFPCPKCRPHIQQRLREYPISNYYGTKDKNGKEIGVAKWSWEFHNAVNQRLKKNIVTWETFVSKYY